MSTESQSWGVAGLGVSGPFSAELLAPCEEGRSWLLELSGPCWSVTLEVEGENAARELHSFVFEHANRETLARHRIGSLHSADFMVVKDSEFADRFWLRCGDGGQSLEITLCGDKSRSFAAALESLIFDLDT